MNIKKDLNINNRLEEHDMIPIKNSKIKKRIKNNENNKNKKDDTRVRKTNYQDRRKICLLMIFLLVSLVILIVLFFPRLTLKGETEIVLNYQDKYQEPGYDVKILSFKINTKVDINSTIQNGKVGSYDVLYKTKLGFLTLKKKRKVVIVDQEKPVIIVNNNLKICPNASLDSIKYQIFDAYDGDLTSKAKIVEENDYVSFQVVDSSGNISTKKINLMRLDDKNPELILKGEKKIYLTVGEVYTEPGYSASDNCDFDLTSKVIVEGQVLNKPGTYQIKYTVSDNSQNTTSVIREVVVTSSLYNQGVIHKGAVYLTFDDGPKRGTTDLILDILKEENVKATFFVTNSGPDDLIKRIYNEGHTIGLHTASHNYKYIYSSIDNYFADLNKVSQRVNKITGVQSKIIRFPGGSSNTISRSYQRGIMSNLTKLVISKGYHYFDWNIDSNDASGANTSNAVYNNVIKGLSKNKSNVILMHDVKTTTKDALRDIIKYGKNNGYQFEKIEMDTYMVRHSVNN